MIGGDAGTPHAEIADELRRMESGLGSSKSPSIGEAGDVVNGADDDSACATDCAADTAATASGDDPVVEPLPLLALYGHVYMQHMLDAWWRATAPHLARVPALRPNPRPQP